MNPKSTKRHDPQIYAHVVRVRRTFRSHSRTARPLASVHEFARTGSPVENSQFYSPWNSGFAEGQYRVSG